MRAVLLIASTYFTVVPLQRWLGGIGGCMVLAGMALRVLGHGKQAATGHLMLLLFGTTLVALVPVMLGGGMMRAASSRLVLHQLPWGRQRMVLGATLAVTVLAGAATLIYVLTGALDGAAVLRNDPFRGVSPLVVFAVSWSACAMLWLTTFITSGSRILSMLIGFLPLSLIVLGKTVGRNYAGPVPGASSLFIASAVIWTGFALSYLRAPSIRRLIYGKAAVAAAAAAAADTPLARLLRSVETTARSTVSRAQAVELYLLGSSSRLSHAMIGAAWVLGAAIIVLVFRAFMAYSADAPSIPGNLPVLFLLPAILMTPAGIAWLMTRRARMLWLRAGLDRAALFARVERSGLGAGLLALGIPIVAFTASALASWPDRAAIIGMFATAQFLFCICLFYGGLSLTRGWTTADVLLCLGLAALLALEVLALQPWSDTQPAAWPTVLVLVLLVPVLRWHARRRWFALDWRVARMPQMLRNA